MPTKDHADFISSVRISIPKGFAANLAAQGLTKTTIKNSIKRPDSWQQIMLKVPDEVRNNIPKWTTFDLPAGAESLRNREIPSEVDSGIFLFTKFIESFGSKNDYWLLITCRLQEPKKNTDKNANNQQKQPPGKRRRSSAATVRRTLFAEMAWRLYKNEFNSERWSWPLDAMRELCDKFGMPFKVQGETTTLLAARLFPYQVNADTLLPRRMEYISRHICSRHRTWEQSIRRSVSNDDGTVTTSHAKGSASCFWVILAFCIDLKHYYSYLLRHGVTSAALKSYVKKGDIPV